MLVLEIKDIKELIQKVGYREFYLTLIKTLEEDYSNWENFDKTPRVANHVDGGVIELMPISDDKLYSFKYVNGHPKNPEQDNLLIKDDIMKTIGMLGGMSWESSVVYYDLVNKKVRELLGGFHSCKNIMTTVDFAEIQRLQHLEDWKTLDKLMVASAKQLEIAGADIIVLCTNTMHLCAPAILENISIPFLHIAEACGQEISKRKIKKVALLGTKFTMEKDFYKTYIFKHFGIEVIIPTDEERLDIHRIIYQELVQGKIIDSSREIY